MSALSATGLRYFGTVEDPPIYAPRPAFLQYFVTKPCLIGSNTTNTIVLLSPATGHSRAKAALDGMTGLAADWEAIGAEPPNQISKDLALRCLEGSYLMGRFEPSYVTASAEGGVGIVYRSENRYAAIECLNSGEVWLLWYDEDSNPHSQQIEDNSAAISDALRQVSALHADA